MNQHPTVIKRALLSVSDKRGLVEFARELVKLDIEIISTGGTSQLLQDAHIPVRHVEALTGFPEMMAGRLKTLHPKIHGGILGLRDAHHETAKEHGIEWIDLVVVNLYPFAETIQSANTTFDQAIEQIDIGGPTMIRAAAKNMGWVAVVVDPSDYSSVMTELHAQKSVPFETRKKLATKAFSYTAHYDQVIQGYLDSSVKTLQLKKWADLRYGENPHQTAAAYRLPETSGILNAIQHQGKQLSYNNITDADAALSCVREFQEPACVVVKHANPCGVALADTLLHAFEKAYAADSQSAFGGIVALNQVCDRALAEKLTQTFFEVIIAPDFTSDALTLLATKPTMRVLALDFSKYVMHTVSEYKFIEGGVLIQDRDLSSLLTTELRVVTEVKPSESAMQAMRFAWPVVKHIKSNAILIAKDNQTLGVGAGQVSRVDAVDIALKKAGAKTHQAILASDAFFPFRDSIDRLAGHGISAIIQPGGSLRDAEVIAACNEQGMAMVFTGVRCFKH